MALSEDGTEAASLFSMLEMKNGFGRKQLIGCWRNSQQRRNKNDDLISCVEV